MRGRLYALAGVVLLTIGLAAGYERYVEGRLLVPVPEKNLQLSKLLAQIRTATQRYLDVEQAEADGYMQISGHVPLEGIHFQKAEITKVDYVRPSTLLYVRSEGQWQLAGLGYTVKGERPTESPFPGINWERRPATCRYADWHEFPAHSRDACPKAHPETQSLFGAWPPDSWVIKLWLWYPNPNGLFAGVNPLLEPFDDHTSPQHAHHASHHGSHQHATQQVEARSWAEWKAHAAFANTNHRVAGWLVLLMGFAMIVPAVWDEEKGWKPNLVWAAVALGLAAFILYRSDSEYSPFGTKSPLEILGDREAVEHKFSGLIVLAMAGVEWLRVRGTLAHWGWGMVFPWLAITGGTILLLHLHPVSNFAQLGRPNVPHITEGITAILAGVSYLLVDWRIATHRWWKPVPAILTLVMGVQLLLYLE